MQQVRKQRQPERVSLVSALLPLESSALPATRKGRATRERLLLAAEAIFGERGYEAARVSDIVAEAAVSHGLFYRHFPDKDAILFAVLTRLYDELRHSSCIQQHALFDLGRQA